VAYHRRLRTISSLRTGLEEIPGVGPKRWRALLSHFGSLARLRAAEVGAIAGVDGINAELAAQIHQFLHNAPTLPTDDDDGAAEDGEE